jgi:hypothetical protein
VTQKTFICLCFIMADRDLMIQMLLRDVIIVANHHRRFPGENSTIHRSIAKQHRCYLVIVECLVEKQMTRTNGRFSGAVAESDVT